MELRQLQYFLTVAEEESFVKASKRAYVSQQALSKSIMSLEQELNTTLFIRGPHGVKLTEAGQLLFRRAYNISYYISDTIREIREFKNPSKKHVSLSVARGVENCTFFYKILDFEKEYPEYTLSTVSTDDQKVEQMVIDGSVNLGIIGGLNTHESLEYIPLNKPTMFLAVNNKNPLCQKESLSLSDLKDVPLVGSSSFYHFYNRLTTLCNLQGFSPKFTFQTENILYINRLLINNQGCFLCPNDDMEYLDSEQISLIPFKETALNYFTFLVYKKNAALPEATQIFRDYILKIFTKSDTYDNNFEL